jgi:AraC-like DNA-binding protein
MYGDNHIIKLNRVFFFNAVHSPFPVVPHTIPYGCEIVEVLNGGEVFFEQDGKIRRFSRGAIFWHASGENTIWDTTRTSPYRCTVFIFAVKSSSRITPRVSFWRGNSQSLEDFLRFSRSWFARSPEDPLLCNYCFSTLAAQANAPAEANSSMMPETGRISASSKLFKLIHHIEKNLSTGISIETMCKISGMSRNHLFAEFKRELGITPHSFIIECRIAEARRMLEESSMSIKEISDSCGFENIEVFYRTFKQFTSLPPGEYRSSYSSYYLSPDAQN